MGQDSCEVCRARASQRCGGCHQVYYCNREHQKQDWKAHKGQCRPFKVCQDSVMGRCLEATRPIRAGEVILREDPLVAAPAQITVPVCLGCLEPLRDGSTIVECPRCGWPMCSAECATKEAHKPECDVTALWRGEKVSIRNFSLAHPMYQCVGALRVLWSKEGAPGVWRRLWALESHDEERRHTAKWQQDLVAVAQFARGFFRAEDRFSEDDVMRVCGILQVNGHEVPLVEPSYVAVYDAASLLEHSCRPNCSKSFASSGALVIRAAEPVARGQRMSICYSDALWGTANRRHHLHETKFFWCRCPRCADPTEGGTFFSALRCPGECDGAVVPERPIAEPGSTPEEEEDLDAMRWTCRVCGRRLSSEEVYKMLAEVGSELASLQKGDAGACERFVSRWGGPRGPLHDSHFYLTDARLALAQLYGHDQDNKGQGHGQGLGMGMGIAAASDQQLLDRMALCRSLLQLIDALVPAEHRVRGMLRFELHATLAEDARRKGLRGDVDQSELRQRLLESKRLLEEAVDLLRFEPPILPEGQIVIQAMQNLRDLETLLRGLHMALGGDSPL